MVRLLLALSAVALAVAFALAPIERQSIEYAWDATADGASVPLLLIERVPDEFELAFPCPALEQGDGLLFTSSRTPEEVPSLLIETLDDKLIVEAPRGSRGPTRAEVDLARQPGDRCEIVVSYDRQTPELAVAVDGETTRLEGADEAAFELTGLHWRGEPQDVRATIVTSPSSAARNSLSQKLLLLALGALAAVALAWGYKDRSGRGARVTLRPGWWKPHASEWLMLVVAVVVAIVDMPRVDDGRILARGRLLRGEVLLSNVSTVFENRPVPQRYVLEWIFGNTVAGSPVILTLRSLSVLAAVASWILLRRWVLPRISDGEPSRAMVTGAWAVHALFVAAWFATLRPEPFLVLLTVVVLAVLAAWPGEVRAWPYAVVTGSMGLALATHLAGFVVVLAGAPILWWAARELREQATPVIVGAAWGGALSIVALFIGSNVAHTYAAITTFRDGDGHSLGPLDSARYVEQALTTSSTTMRGTMALFAIGAVALTVRVFSREDWTFATRRSALLVGAAIAPLGLLMTPSKWIWHLAVLLPTAVVGWGWIVHRSQRRALRSLAPSLASGVVAGLVIAWMLEPAWHVRTLGGWGGVGLRRLYGGVWNTHLPWLAGEDVRLWFWIPLAATVAFLAWRFADRERQSTSMPSAIAALVLLAASVSAPVQLLPPVADAVVSGRDWTFVRQSALGIVSRSAACGVPADTPAVRALMSDLAPRLVRDRELTIAVNTRGGLFAPCHSNIGQRDGVWEIPSVLMGEPEVGQRRLLTEFEVVHLGCNSFPRERSEDRLCFSVLESDHPQLSPVASRWHLQ